jgi:hypothetical protein
VHGEGARVGASEPKLRGRADSDLFASEGSVLLQLLRPPCRGRFEGVVGWDFIDSLSGINEFGHWRRSSEISDPLSLHDVLDRVIVLDEGDDTHLCFTLGALQGVYLVNPL